MITRVEAYRYRCFERLGMDCRRYQVVVGRNGAGKSTLLDIPVLIGEMLQQRDIEEVFFGERPRMAPRASSAQDLVFSRKGDWFALAVEVRLPDYIAEQLERKGLAYLSKREQAERERDPSRAAGHQDFATLRGALEAETLWTPGEPKPNDLKLARDRAVKLGGKKTGGPIFKGVLGKILNKALNQCVEPGFGTLREAVQRWFPKQAEAWQK